MLTLKLMTYNTRMIELRKEKGWSLDKLAEITGLCKSTVAMAETLKRRPSDESKRQIAIALGSTVDYLFPEELDRVINFNMHDNHVRRIDGPEVISLTEASEQKLLTSGSDSLEDIAEHEANLNDLKENLALVIDSLTPREQKVIKLRFGLDGTYPHTYQQISDEFEVTRERIRQIEARAFEKLRHPSRKRKLKDNLE